MYQNHEATGTVKQIGALNISKVAHQLCHTALVEPFPIRARNVNEV